MKPLAPNTLIQNRYLVVQLIGRGGMGDVYLAVDQRLGSAIALKRTFFSDDEILRGAFEREAKMLARLRHPALPKVSDHFTEDDVQYLVMEHISGDDLSKRLEQLDKPFPASWVVFWADQLLDALSYLHSHEPPIIHRDIKPQNLKLTNENHIILLDFGLAKNSIGETRLSTTGNVIAYTPNYASMEQIRGTGTTARSDIYSLSATMYQLLSNVVPADALSRADAVLNNQPDPIQPLTQLNSEVSPAVSQVIMRGLSLSAEQRFATAKEMQVALREAFSKVQESMSANTVAFKMADENKPGDTVPPQSSINTVAFSTPIPSEPVGEKTEVLPANLIGVTQPAPAQTDLGATVGSGVPFQDEKIAVESPSFVEKTEVLPDSFGTPYQNEHISEQKFVPEATMPVGAFEERISDLPNQKTEEFSIPNQNKFDSQPQQNKAVVPPVTEVKKKTAGSGGGKTFAIIGVLLALGAIGLAAIGGGLYMFKPELLGIAESSPTPKPTAEPTALPSTPTPEPTIEISSNSSQSNSDDSNNKGTSNTSTDSANKGLNNSEKPEPTKTIEVVADKTPIDKTGQSTPPKATPTPRVVTQNTPVKTQPVKTPAPTPAKAKTPSRTDILQ